MNKSQEEFTDTKADRCMSVEIGNNDAHFCFWKYINRILFAVWWDPRNSTTSSYVCLTKSLDCTVEYTRSSWIYRAKYTNIAINDTHHFCHFWDCPFKYCIWGLVSRGMVNCGMAAAPGIYTNVAKVFFNNALKGQYSQIFSQVHMWNRWLKSLPSWADNNRK